MDELARCRVITSRHSPRTVAGTVLWSWELCQRPGPTRSMDDGVRVEVLPTCDDHWAYLWDETGAPMFWIDSVESGDPVVQPNAIGPRPTTGRDE